MADDLPVGSDGRAEGGVEVSTTDDGVLVAFWGVVDVVVRDRGSAELWELRVRPGGVMSIDCRRVDAMDSTGLSVLVRLVRDAVEDAQPVRFLGASALVEDLLATSGVGAWMADLGVELTSGQEGSGGSMRA